MNFFDLEHYARRLCEIQGGNWSAHKHKRNHWRWKFLELVNGC